MTLQNSSGPWPCMSLCCASIHCCSGQCVQCYTVLLPCPRPFTELLCSLRVSLRFLLLRSGDIEANPGPDNDQIMEELKKISGDINDIKKEKSVTNAKLIAIDKKLEKIASLEKKVTDCVQKIAELEQKLSVMTRKVDELDNRSRRSNLIIYGVKEEENESEDILREKVTKEIFQDILEVNTSCIERIHRLGRVHQQEEAKHRPIILKLLDYRDKTAILKQCKKLKGSEYSISEDYSKTVRDIRKKLWTRTKDNRDRKDKVYLTYDKVRINNQLYAWDESRNDIVELSKNESQDDTATRVTRRRRP